MINGFINKNSMYIMMLTIIMKTLVTHIMVVPKDRNESFLAYKIMELVFAKGDENALDVIIFYESIQFYTLMVERYSCIYDIFYLTIIRTITHVIPMYVVIVFCYSMSLLTYSEFTRISNPIAYYYKQTELNVHLIMLHNQIQIIMIIIYHICQKKKYNQANVFGIIFLISYLTRIPITAWLYFKGQFKPVIFEQIVNSNPFSMIYASALAFVVCSKTIKIDVKPLYLFNNYVKTKFQFVLNKQQKQAIDVMAACALVGLLYFDVCLERSDNSKLLLTMLFKIMYKFIQMSIICYIYVAHVLCSSENKHASYKNIKTRLMQNQKIEIPGFEIEYYIYLALIPVSSFILKYVQSTIMGPYHPLFLLLIILGVMGCCMLVGTIIQTLYYWVLKNMIIFTTDIFNDLKKQHIRQLIRENIYNRDYQTDVELKKKQDEQKMKDQIQKLIEE